MTEVLTVPAAGRRLRSHADALEIVGEALGRGADLVVVPVARLHDDFFDLATGVAGDLLQTFVTYRLRLAVVGDISAQLAASSALRALVAESNRGRQAWFALDDGALAARLRPSPPGAGPSGEGPGPALS